MTTTTTKGILGSSLSLVLVLCLLLQWSSFSNFKLEYSHHHQQQQQQAQQFSGTRSSKSESVDNHNNITTHSSTSDNNHDNDETGKSKPNVSSHEIPALKEPWDILEQYMAWHSQHALDQELHANTTGIHRRSYALAFYSCPNQLGNRLHHFLNSFLWSILTNRTLLWQYWDYKTCHKYGSHYDGRICDTANTVQDCDIYVRREKWIPSYQAWKQQQQFLDKSMTQQEPFELSYWTTHAPNVKPGRGWPSYNASFAVLQNQLGIDSPIRQQQYPVVVFPPMLGQTDAASLMTALRHLLRTDRARQLAKNLYRYGPNVLYGLLFHAAFAVDRTFLQDNVTTTIIPNSNFDHYRDAGANSTSSSLSDTDAATELSNHCSLTVHSRHTNSSDTGEDVQAEIRCIEDLWQQQLLRQGINSTLEECDLFLLSDRPMTLKHLVTWCMEQLPPPSNNSTLNNFPCRRVVFASHVQSVSFSPEHGPYAGVGFLQDLLVAQQSAMTSIGVVGGRRSSTDLLVEWLEYDRLLHFLDHNGSSRHWNIISSLSSKSHESRRWVRQASGREFQDRPIPELPRCFLPT